MRGPGDEIFILGFSHGAFAARALAALITEIGLLNKYGMGQFDTLYDTYFNSSSWKIRKTSDYASFYKSYNKLRYEISMTEGVIIDRVAVKMLGCLDTVGWLSYEDEFSTKEEEKENQRLVEKGLLNFRHLIIHEGKVGLIGLAVCYSSKHDRLADQTIVTSLSK